MIRIILVVDDPNSAQDIQNRLQQMSYDVVALTATADEVITRTDELRPDIILMDVRLKGETDGIEVAEQIKSLHDIPIIFLTANADEATVRRAIAAEPDGFLIEPLDELELIAAIDVALHKQKKEQDALASERRIRELTNALPVVVYEADATGRMTFVNTTAFHLFGYTKEEVEAGMSVFQLVADADKERARAVFHRRMSGEDVGREEYTGLRKDGSTFPISVQAVLIRQDGAVVGQRGVILDVTELKQAEEELQIAASFPSENPDPVIRLSGDGTLLYANNAASKVFGEYPDNLDTAGESLLSLFRDATADALQAKAARRIEVSVADQTFEFSAAPIVERQHVNFYGADITERKHTEELAREHVHTIEVLNHIMAEGNQAASVESFAETVTNLTLKLLHFDVGTIHLGDDDARWAYLRYATGVPDTVVEAIRELPLDEAPYAGFLLEPSPLFLDGREASRVPHVAELGLESLAVVPLYRYDELIGALNVGSFKRHNFSQTEKELLIAIGNEVGVVIAKLRADELIRAALNERETLLKEIHHRVKNSMQVISSLLSLQAAKAAPEAIEVLNESQKQIRSMALIHEKLYRSSSLAEIDFADYVESLIDELLRMYNVPLGAITITVDIENVQLGVDTAIPCALIINELVSNSLKYAFPDRRPGDVTVALQRTNGAHTLTVGDGGVGFPADVDFRATDSLGMQLVATLVGQLDGTITLDRTKGTTFIITFKPADAHERV